MKKRKLERLTRRGDVETLKMILADLDPQRAADGSVIDANWERRVAAISALAEVGDAEAEDAVVAALNDAIGPVRRAAVDALAVIRTETALPRLAYGCATWSDPSDPARVGALRLFRETSNRSVAVSYANGLVGTDSSFPPDELDEEAVRGFVEADTSARLADDLANFLVTQLASQDAERAGRAEAILAWLGEAGVRAAEEAALEIEGAGAGAARVLGRIGEEGSIPTLREMLDRAANAEDRRAAAMALAELRTPLAIEPLLGATRDPHRAVRDAALSGLDTYGVMATVALIGGVARPGQNSVLTRGQAEQDPPAVQQVPAPDRSPAPPADAPEDTSPPPATPEPLPPDTPEPQHAPASQVAPAPDTESAPAPPDTPEPHIAPAPPDTPEPHIAPAPPDTPEPPHPSGQIAPTPETESAPAPDTTAAPESTPPPDRPRARTRWWRRRDRS